jgi:uncharacterized protein (DUF885 family)
VIEVTAGPEPVEPRALLDRLAQRSLDAELALSPTLGTFLGARASDDRLDDVRAESLARELGRCRALLERLRSQSTAPLDAAHLLERTLLVQRLEATLFELGELRPHERNPLFYADLLDASMDELLSDPALTSPERLRTVTARLWKFRTLVDEARRNLRGGGPQGAPELAVRRASERLAGLRAVVGEVIPRVLSSGDPKQLDELRAAVGDAGRALDDFAAWLSRDLMPRARGELALSAGRFSEKLRVAEGVALPPEELAAAFERAVREARRRLDELGRQLLRGGGDVVRLLEDDHPGPTEVLPYAESIVEGVRAAARPLRLASEPGPVDGGAAAAGPLVVEMPPQLWGFVRLILPRPLEAHPRDAVLFIDSADPSWAERRRTEHLRALNRSALALRLMHELGGHLPVAERARQAPTLLARVSSTTTFVEGFAHYAERALIDGGYAPGDLKLRYAVERAALIRAVRALGAVRFHALGARLEDVIKLFVDEVGLDEVQARREGERVAVDPMVLVDCLGRLMIERLRTDWLAAHPEAGLGRFHESLLREGAIPLPLVRRRMLPGAPTPLL